MFEDFDTDDVYEHSVIAMANFYQNQLTESNFERIKDLILQNERTDTFDQKTDQMIPTANARLATKFEDMQYGDDSFNHLRDVEFDPHQIKIRGPDVWPEIDLAMFLAHMTGTQIIVICMDVSNKNTGCPRVFYFNKGRSVSAVLIKTNGHYDIVDISGLTAPEVPSVLAPSAPPAPLPEIAGAGRERIRDFPIELGQQLSPMFDDGSFALALQLEEKERAAQEARDFDFAQEELTQMEMDEAYARGLAEAEQYFT